MAMFMEWIKIENYRNLVDIELHFHNDINYFVGENAVGKSNFLEPLRANDECTRFSRK